MYFIKPLLAIKTLEHPDSPDLISCLDSWKEKEKKHSAQRVSTFNL